MSAFEVYRRKFKPTLPRAIQGASYNLHTGEKTHPVADEQDVAALFPKTTHLPLLDIQPDTGAPKLLEPKRVGVIFSGGQAPGGHNVLCGLYDKLQQIAPKSVLLGFQNGPKGLMTNKYVEITDDFLKPFRNMGGFHAIGSGRDKIAKPEDFEAAAKTAKDNNLDIVCIIGGDDSNTNACLLAEDFLKRGLKTAVIGVPKTIDRDLYSTKGIECSFGFDSSTKVYAELIGNICYDCLSAKKYWHFIRLMGRSASHITLECGLQTHANICLIGEEVLNRKMTSRQLFEHLADCITKRADSGKNYGICLVPEGLIEFIPENNELFAYLNNTLLPKWTGELTADAVAAKLPDPLKATFMAIPAGIRTQLLLDRDPHGNIAISQIETEKFLGAGVQQVLKERGSKVKFTPLYHFFGYEGRCAAPSDFDCSLCYSLGAVAAILGCNGKTGYMASLRGLVKPPAEWLPIGLPLTCLMNMEMRHGHKTPVIMKQMTDLNGNPYKLLVKNRDAWLMNDDYQNPGPIQQIATESAEGTAVCARPTITLIEEAKK